MGKVKTFALPAALLVVAAVMGAVCACGGGNDVATTPAGVAEEILGREPSGLAKTIVDRGAVIVANDAKYPPQSSENKTTGKLEGFDVDVARKVGQILKLRVEFRNPVWETVPTLLGKGRFDVSIGSLPVTAEMQKKLDLTAPYYYMIGRVFVKKGGAQILGVADLTGMKVGVVVPTTCYEYLKENSDAELAIYDTEAEAFSDLESGELDFVMAPEQAGQAAISAGRLVEHSGKPLYYEGLAFAVKKGESDWLAMLDYAVKTMHEDGSLTAMSKEWYGTDLTVKK